MKETFGQRLSRLRKEKGLTQEDIASKITISPQAVSKWENGNSEPDLDTLDKLADILGCSVDELLGREGNASVGAEKEEVASEVVDDEEDKETIKKASKIVQRRVEKKIQENKFFWITSGTLFGLCIVAYIIVGVLWKTDNMGWKTGWLILFISPIVSSLIHAIKVKLFCPFAYPILVTGTYLLLGFLGMHLGFQGWGVYWFLFLTIPAYYMILGPVDEYLKKKRGIEDDDDDEDEDDD